jgi:ATP-dependent Clp protease protease subunit
MKRFVLSGVVGYEITPEVVQNDLDEAGGDEIDIDLTSIGGYVDKGFQIYNMIRDYPGKKSVTINGYVASIAAYIASAFDVVKARDNSVFMIHNAMNAVYGDYRAMQKEAIELKSINNVIGTAYSKKSGRVLKEILGLMNEETYFYGSEIKDAGLADVVLDTNDTSKNKDQQIAAARAAFKALNLKDVSADIKAAIKYLNLDSIDSQINQARSLIEEDEVNDKDILTIEDEDEPIKVGSHIIGKNAVIYRSALRASVSRAGQGGKTTLSAALAGLLKLIEKNGSSNKLQGGKRVNKEELLAMINTMRENAEISLPEIAKAMNLDGLLITEAHKTALAIMTEINKLGITDPIAKINEMITAENANAELVAKAKLDEAFGIAEDNGVKNFKRIYAGEKLNGLRGKELETGIVNIKTDPIMIKFAEEQTDVFNGVNRVDASSASHATPTAGGMRVDKV